MSLIPIFDSLIHPPQSADLTALGRELQTMKRELFAAGIYGGCFVKLEPARDLEKEKQFVKVCLEADAGLQPVSVVDPNQSPSELKKLIEEMSRMGFKSVKIHPRRAKVDWRARGILDVMKVAADVDLAVMLCTYMHTAVPGAPIADPLFQLGELLNQAPSTRTILLHGGDVRVLEYAELVRANKHLLLDLSFTLLKYESSSVDLDLKFLMSKFDQRICIGTDNPDFVFSETRRKFDLLSQGLSDVKKRNIAYRNLMTFLRVEPTERFPVE